jgi:1-aminocyclopropane-1-carboxylate deaminase
MAIDLQEKIRLDIIDNELLRTKGIQLSMLRLDEIHPLVSGNKWFKLKENIKDAIATGSRSLLTFGGAYSNHLSATAAAARAFGLVSVGVVRGLHGVENQTETLKQCAAMGMKLQFVSREDYAKKDEPVFLKELRIQYPDAYIIPEGGDNEQGVKGAGEIASFIPETTGYVALPVGTGTTFAGIRNQLDSDVNMLGFTAVKGGEYLTGEIKEKIHTNDQHWQLITDYHFGGFAKYKPALITFMNEFYEAHHIPLDMVYTAKMMYGILDMVQHDYFPRDANIVCIHTGGLQGNSAVSQFLQYS